MSKQYYVYLLSNFTNNVLYTGVTNDLIRRVYQHKSKQAEGFTSRYNINKLVYYEIFEEAYIAISREKAIKNLVRRKKEVLIENMNPEWKDLYPDIL